MGLFGYNQKDFAKHTDEFKSSIQNFMYEGNCAPETNKILNRILINLDHYAYPQKASGKVLESIDARVVSLLGKMEADIAEGSPEKFTAHAEILMKTISQFRRFGKQPSPKRIEAEDILAETRALLRDAIVRKGEVEAEMAKIEQEAGRLAEGDPQFELLEQQYAELEAKAGMVKNQIDIYRNRHNSNVDIINLQEEGETYDKLPEYISTQAELNEQIKTISKKAEREDMYNSGIQDSIGEYRADRQKVSAERGTKTSSLRDRVEIKKNEEVAKQIEESENESQPVSSLRSRLNRS